MCIDIPILANVHLSLTNIGFYLILGSIIVLIFNIVAVNNDKIISNN